MKTRILGAISLSMALATPLFAADLIPWGESGPWKILIDPAHGKGCLTETALSDGSYLRIGFEEPGSGKGYIASFNPFWTQFKEGEHYDVAIKFTDGGFMGKGKGAKLDDMPGVVVAADNIDLLIALAKAESVNLSTEGGPGLDVALTGSYDALNKALECQAMKN
jgi:hypothetical protein